MKKFLAMFGFMMFALVSFTSCSDNDDGGGGYTSSQLVGTWEAVSAQGVCDVEVYTTDGYETYENYQFNVTFDKPQQGTDEVYNELYERFYNILEFTKDKVYEYNYVSDDNGTQWVKDRYGLDYEIINNKIYTNDKDEYGDDIHYIAIKYLSKDKLVLVMNDHALEEDGTGHSVDVTFKRTK